MNILDRLTRSNTKKKGLVNDYVVGATPRNFMSSSFQFYKGSAYDNAYPSIKAISNAFMQIKPYAIDANGKPLQDNRLVNVLARPNTKMTGADFREALAVCTLVHRKTYLLAWHVENGKAVPGGNITKDNITGFTFLENVAIMPTYDSEGYYYLVDNKYRYSRNEVLEITSGIDPDNLNLGYSPTSAVKKWATVDDCIASFEAGYFENGAVPAGQFVITAGSIEQFNAIVDEMQRHHRGAGKNNAPQYVHRPIGMDGNPTTAQVEWIPFAQSNNTLALGEIFKQANEKIDSVYGVPASIRGVNDNNTYASVKVDEQVFLKYTVKPLAMKIWTRFVSELNRITGGLGYALTFDLELPYIADEEKIEAERKKTELDLILTAQNAGFELDSIIDAFGLTNAYKTLKIGNNTQMQIENDKPEVDEGNEMAEAPNGATDVPKAKSHSLTCSCGEHTHKAIDNKGRKLERELEDVLTSWYAEQVEKTLRANNIAEKAVDELTEEEYLLLLQSFEVEEPTEEEKNHLSEMLAVILLAYMLTRGKKEQDKEWYNLKLKIDAGTVQAPIIGNLAGNIGKTPEKFTKEDLDNALGSYSINNELKNSYTSRLDNITLSFSNQVSESIKNVLKRLETEAQTTGKPMSRVEIAKEIKNVVKTDEWRVERIAITEENHARQLAQIDAMKDLANKLSIKVKKKWLALGASPCEFCQAMNGTVEDVDADFVGIGGVIRGVDGGYLQNNYDIMQSAQAHPNCQCKLEFIFEGENGF